MSNRTAKFASAIFASLLAGAPLATVSHSAPAARRLPVRTEGRRRPRAATGTIASSMPPNATAGISRAEGESRRPRSPDSPPSANRLRREASTADATLGRGCARRIAAAADAYRAGQTPSRPPAPAIAADDASMPSARMPPRRCERRKHRSIASRWPESADASSPVSPQPQRPPQLRLQTRRRTHSRRRRRRRRCRSRPRRRGLVVQKSARLDPDAADRRDGRAVACRPSWEARSSGSAAGAGQASASVRRRSARRTGIAIGTRSGAIG